MQDEISQEKINSRLDDIARVISYAKSDMTDEEFKLFLRALRMPRTVVDGLAASFCSLLIGDISTDVLIAQFTETLKQAESVARRILDEPQPQPYEWRAMKSLFSRAGDLAEEIDRRQFSNTYMRMNADHLDRLKQLYRKK